MAVDSDSRRQYNQAYVANAISRLKRNIRQVTTVHVHIDARIQGGVMGTNPQPQPTLQNSNFSKIYRHVCLAWNFTWTISREIHDRHNLTGRVHYKIMKKYVSDPPPGPLANSNNRRNRIRALYTCKWTSKHSQTVLVMITCTLTERHMYTAYHFISNLGKFYHPCLSQSEAPT